MEIHKRSDIPMCELDGFVVAITSVDKVFCPIKFLEILACWFSLCCSVFGSFVLCHDYRRAENPDSSIHKK